MRRRRRRNDASRGVAPAAGTWMPGGLAGRMAAASALLALIVGAAFLLLLLAIDHARSAEHRANRAQQVLVAANGLERLLLDLESGQRGFVLTGQERFLAPWQAARRTFPVQARALRGLVAGIPEEERLARRLERAGRSYIEDYSVPLVNAARRGDPSVREVEASGAGKQRVDAMRADFDRLISAESRSVAATRSSVNDDADRASAVATVALAGSVVLIGAYATYLARAVVRPVRRVATAAERLAAGDLSVRLSETGAGEIVALERSFNSMAAALERGRDELRRVAEEQAALRRVATLVARAESPGVVFAAVAEEVGLLVGADLTSIARYDAAGTATGVAGWPAGAGVGPGDRDVTSLVFERGRPARLDTVAGVPISVEGRLWGLVVAASTGHHPLPPGIEDRLADFTELVATAIANAQAREELRALVEQQAALQRMATLVAMAAPPERVFAAVAEEVGRLLAADVAFIARYEPDGTASLVVAWSATGKPVPIADQQVVTPDSIMGMVRATGRAGRIDSAVAAPITVQDRLWGLVGVGLAGDEPPAPGTEDRLAEFTELVATAIANAEAQSELRASRARIVTSADETRRQIERDLHDGAQQRLVSLTLRLRAAQATVPPELDELAGELDHVATSLAGAVDELREYARGIHPAILAEGGLGPALKALARRSAIPVVLDVRTTERWPRPVEVGAYYVVSEALANTAKHANATRVTVTVDSVDGVLRVAVHDDGAGGATFAGGSGLLGLKDRVEALGGRIVLRSEVGAGTSLSAELPVPASW